MTSTYRPRRPKPSPFRTKRSARNIIQEHLKADRLFLKELAFGIGLKPDTLYKMFFDPRRPLSPDHIEAMIAWLKLDDFDSNELRLQAAREAGWKIDLRFLSENKKA